MWVEFIIRGGPDHDFDLIADQLADALRPLKTNIQSLPGFNESHLDIEVEGVRIRFSPEPPGWQVSMLNPPDRDWAERIAGSICQNMSEVSGHPGEVIRI